MSPEWPVSGSPRRSAAGLAAGRDDRHSELVLRARRGRRARGCGGRASASAVLVDEAEQRLERCAGIDEDRRSARFVADDVRIREEARIHASADQHGRYASGTNSPGGHMAGLISRTTMIVEGEVFEAAEQGREPERDARLLVRGAAAPAPERQARDRRRRDIEEAPRNAVHLDAAAGRQARRPGQAGACGEPRISLARR